MGYTLFEVAKRRMEEKRDTASELFDFPRLKPYLDSVWEYTVRCGFVQEMGLEKRPGEVLGYFQPVVASYPNLTMSAEAAQARLRATWMAFDQEKEITTNFSLYQSIQTGDGNLDLHVSLNPNSERILTSVGVTIYLRGKKVSMLDRIWRIDGSGGITMAAGMKEFAQIGVDRTMFNGFDPVMAEKMVMKMLMGKSVLTHDGEIADIGEAVEVYRGLAK